MKNFLFIIVFFLALVSVGANSQTLNEKQKQAKIEKLKKDIDNKMAELVTLNGKITQNYKDIKTVKATFALQDKVQEQYDVLQEEYYNLTGNNHEPDIAKILNPNKVASTNGDFKSSEEWIMSVKSEVGNFTKSFETFKSCKN
jgi:hypothetical protein